MDQQSNDLLLNIITAGSGLLGLAVSFGHTGPAWTMLAFCAAASLIATVLYLGEITRLLSLHKDDERYAYSFGFCQVMQRASIFALTAQAVIFIALTYG